APAKGVQNGVIHREKNFQIAWDHGSDGVRGGATLSIDKKWHAARFGALLGETWYHLATSFDGTALRAYTNGVLVATNRDAVGQPDNERTSLKFGRHAVQNNYFRGALGEVRIYNRALSDADVEMLFLAGGSKK